MEMYDKLYSLAWKLLNQIDPGLVKYDPAWCKKWINATIIRAIATAYRDSGHRPLFVLLPAEKNIRMRQMIKLVTDATLGVGHDKNAIRLK